MTAHQLKELATTCRILIKAISRLEPGELRDARKDRYLANAQQIRKQALRGDIPSPQQTELLNRSIRSVSKLFPGLKHALAS